MAMSQTEVQMAHRTNDWGQFTPSAITKGTPERMARSFPLDQIWVI
eukprot:CAMPEP_0114549564 /NCGR_PEP_ID=MMETSP0114-20121206/5595_1 /TAXON_ID=31324 /ORGANISM="Goniomonas sp, Strain m" /LENGTH=45 /DNA_ID= /DNA_START= /DNA_END= /DNA_ORIENTATION=